MSDGPRIGTLDIETSPHLSYHFGSYKVDIAPIQTIEPARMLCHAFKWRDGKKIHYHHEDSSSHSAMVEAAVRFLDEADVVVTYNGDNFDLPWIEWERKLWGLPKPSPFVSVDLYKIVAKNFKNAPLRRSLDYITSQLNLTGKLAHKGYFPLWLEMNSDDPVVAQRAKETFRRYNKRDVLTTEELLGALWDDVTNIPHVGLYSEQEALFEVLACPSCGSSHVTSQGYRRTKTRRYKQYQCQDCARWFSETRSDKSVQAS